MRAPLLGRFLSADSIVPGAADGSGGGAGTLGYDKSTRLTPLTTDFHEFVAQVGSENAEVLQYGPFFQWSDKVRKEHNVSMGPLNPQALNRYSYVLNNPLRYVDPTGHETYKLRLQDVKALRDQLFWIAEQLREGVLVTTIAGVGADLTTAGLGGAALADFEPATKTGLAIAAVGSALVSVFLGAKGLIDGYALWEVDSMVTLLDQAMEHTDSAGLVTLSIEHRDAFGFTAELRCQGCDLKVILRDWFIGGRHEQTAILWDYFEQANQH